MAHATGVGLARQLRARAASAQRASSRRRNLAIMKPAWWRLLFDVARGAHVGPLPRREGAALQARGLVDGTGAVTREGRYRLLAARHDPIADRSDDERVAFYEAMRDAPAWPSQGGGR